MSDENPTMIPSYTIEDFNLPEEIFCSPKHGRGIMPKGQHPIVRVKTNQWFFDVAGFTYLGDKLWIDQCQNPATPEWLQTAGIWSGVDASSHLPMATIKSNIEHQQFDDNLSNSIVGCSEAAMRQQIMDNGYDPALYGYDCLTEPFRVISQMIELTAKQWTYHPVAPIGHNLSLTIVQAIGSDDATNTVYGRIFQPDGASDCEETCREGISQNALLAFPFNDIDEVSRGDIFIVWSKEWVSSGGRIFDAVNLANHPPPTRLPANNEIWETTPTCRIKNNSNDDAQMIGRSYGTGIKLEVGQITPTHMIHPSRSNAFGFWVAHALFKELAITGEISAGHISDSIPDMFIEAWRDKRKAKEINLAKPFYPHYHDEIRCPTCNGKVLVLAKADNKTTQVDCPHCKSKKAIQFPHLTDASVKAVGLHE